MIKLELRRHSVIEPVIGHMKTDGHLSRSHLNGREVDAAVVLTALGHNLRLVLASLRLPWRLILNVLSRLLAAPTALRSAC